jgi:hypothetical protein
MDLNRFPISLMLVALQVQFVCKSKIELMIIICSRSTRAYISNFYEIIMSLDYSQNPQRKLVIFNLYLTKDYIEVLLFF